MFQSLPARLSWPYSLHGPKAFQYRGDAWRLRASSSQACLEERNDVLRRHILGENLRGTDEQAAIGGKCVEDAIGLVDDVAGPAANQCEVVDAAVQGETDGTAGALTELLEAGVVVVFDIGGEGVPTIDADLGSNPPAAARCSRRSGTTTLAP